MSEIAFPTWAVYSVLENRLILAEALTFPEVSRFGRDGERLRQTLRANLQPLIERAPLPSLIRRHLGGKPELSSAEITLDTPPGTLLWGEPLTLKFPVVRWTHSAHLEVAYLPFPGVEVFAEDAEALARRLPVEIRAALARGGLASTLRPLVTLQRATRLRSDVRVRLTRGVIAPSKFRPCPERRHLPG